MRVLLAPVVTSSVRSTSTSYTESLRPPRIHCYYKRISSYYSISYLNTLHPTIKLKQTAHLNLSPFSTSRSPSMMVSITEIVLYYFILVKPTAEHDVYVPPTRRTISIS